MPCNFSVVLVLLLQVFVIICSRYIDPTPLINCLGLDTGQQQVIQDEIL